jgi:hypothetical protein
VADSDPLDDAKRAVSLVGELMQVVGKSPETVQAGQELGKAALTVAKCINNALLPIAAVNFGFAKARAYFADKFEHDMAEQAAAIPPEHLVEPKASIAGPALQGLAFSHDEPPLKAMYLNLLASAMNTVTSESAHPAFAEIIKQLTAEEAALLRYVLPNVVGLPIVEVRLTESDGGGYTLVHRHLTNHCDADKGTPIERPQLPAMIVNWERLGLVAVQYGVYFQGAEAYDWVEKRPEIKRYRAEKENETHKINVERGVLSATPLGSLFATAVGLKES